MPLKFKVANGKGGIISSGVCHPAKNFTLFFDLFEFPVLLAVKEQFAGLAFREKTKNHLRHILKVSINVCGVKW